MSNKKIAFLHSISCTEPNEDIKEVIAEATKLWNLFPDEVAKLEKEGELYRPSGDMVTLDHFFE